MAKLCLEPYKKAIVIKGDTYEVKDVLKDLQGKWFQQPQIHGWLCPGSWKEVVLNSLRCNPRIASVEDRTNVSDVKPSLQGVDGGQVRKRPSGDSKIVSARKRPSCDSRPIDFVANLKAKFDAAADGLQTLRDVLPVALQNLSFPREKRLESKPIKLGQKRPHSAVHGDDQTHLRMIAQKCLRQIWMHWKADRSEEDSKLLKDSVEQVLKIISDYEHGKASISGAMAAKEWLCLRDIASEIASGLEAGSQKQKVVVSHEGWGTAALIKCAFEKIGGQATAREIITWIEKNPSQVKRLNVVLNKRPTAAKDRPSGMPTWHLTVSSCLSQSGLFERTGEIKDGAALWRMIAETDRPDTVDAGSRKKRRFAVDAA